MEIQLPKCKDLNFTLPALTLQFVKNGPIFERTESRTNYTGFPDASNWAFITKRTQTPAFVSISIPAWLNKNTLTVAGYYREKIEIEITKS